MNYNRKIVFDQKTLLFKPVRKNWKLPILVVGSILIIGGFLAFSLSPSSSGLNPVITKTDYEFKKLQDKYALLNKQIDQYASSLEKIHQKDKNIYRVVYGVNPVDENIWQGGTGGKKSNRGYYNHDWNFSVSNIEDKATKLEHQISMQTKSLDKLLEIAKDKEKYFRSIPSIIPVQKNLLERNVNLLSGFGRRMHPIFKIWKKHEGIDLTCPKGTAIISPGDGVVISVNGHGRGYGNHVVVSHGYGYETLFAHMSEISVHEGQKVERGTVLGLVGETGYATAPHLHYEVHIDGSPVNPIDYIMDGLSTKEYQEMVRKAAVEGKSLD